MNNIKVLIVEDSKLMQEVLRKILTADPDIEVVGTAADPLLARDLIKKLKPTVITLDIMLPHMDGITFLKNLMRLNPLPVVMVSTLTEEGGALAIEALAIGAYDCITKPKADEENQLTQFARELTKAVKGAAIANVKTEFKYKDNDKKLQGVIYKSNILKNTIIGIGASTGGIEALESILLQLPQIFPPVVIVQHIKKEFSSAFSNRMKRLYGLLVIEPDVTTELLPGYIYIAPADKHLTISKDKNKYVTLLNDLDAVNGHKPSVDILFDSIAKIAGANSVGILLTGMGKDGAQGLKSIRDAGGVTIAQDKASSVVWGMPGTAVQLDAVDHIVSLDKIPQTILNILDKKLVQAEGSTTK